MFFEDAYEKDTSCHSCDFCDWIGPAGKRKEYCLKTAKRVVKDYVTGDIVYKKLKLCKDVRKGKICDNFERKPIGGL